MNRWNRIVRYGGLIRLVACAWAATAWGSCSSTIAYCQNPNFTHFYNAGGAATAWDPASAYFGWRAHNIGPGTNHMGISVPNEPSLGLNAWGIHDNSASTANPFYSQCLDGALSSGVCSSSGFVSGPAAQYGWRYATKARLASDFGTTESMGLSVWLGNQGYFVMFDLDGANLRATLLNGTTPTRIPLTTGGAGALTYHDIALVYLPATRRVAFEFDGVIRGYTTGQTQLHENALLWGNLSGGGRGQMNFHEVSFEVLLPGDYNRDHVVDAADYTVWRNTVGTNLAAADGDENGVVNSVDYQFWKSRFGNSGPLLFGLAIAVPEPGGVMLMLAAGVIIAATSSHHRGPKCMLTP